MSQNHPHETQRTVASVEWYELPILGEKPRLTPRALALRWFGAGLLTLLACLGGGLLWWLL